MENGLGVAYILFRGGSMFSPGNGFKTEGEIVQSI